MAAEARDGRPRRRRRQARGRLGSVRVRTTLTATLVVAAALVVGAVILVLTLRAALTRGVERSVRQQVATAAGLVSQGETPGVVDSDDDDLAAQIVDADGHVLAASRLAQRAGDKPLVDDLEPGRSSVVVVSGTGERFLAVTATAHTSEGPRTVIVAATLEVAEQSSSLVTLLLLIGLPLVIGLVAAITWRTVGRALAPVDEITTAADAVSGTDLTRRVPTPGSEDEIARLARTMNRMLDRLEEAQRRQRRFVSDASHELRSPVAAVRQHAEVARAHPESTTTRGLADTVLAEAWRLQRLVDDLLVVAHADEDQPALHRHPVELDDIVLEEVRRLHTTTDLDVDATAVSAGAVAGDADALRRVVRNVVDNAARHAATRVSFALAERDGTVTLAVEDDGPGVPPSDRDRVFERFVRLDDARARPDDAGSGLGLAIVAELIDALDGRVDMTDAALGGTRIEISLPALQ